MGTSDITVTALTATPGIGHNALKFSYSDPRDGALPAIALDVVEVHAASTNDRSLASKIDEGKDKAFHMAIVEGTTHYYWAKARNKAGNYGDWFPSGATSGVIGTVGFAAGAAHALINGKITATRDGSSNVTVRVKTLSGDDPSSANPVFIGFRSIAGTYVVRSITAALLHTISAGSSHGAGNGQCSRLWLPFFDDDGVVRMSSINCSSSGSVLPLSEIGTASATAEGGAGAADTAGVFYAPVAITSKQFRVVAFIEWTSPIATAGQYPNDPNIIHLVGPATKMPGDIVQPRISGGSVHLSGVNDTPYDDTEPLVGEGALVTTAALTPSSPCNTVIVEAIGYASRSNAGPITAAIIEASGLDGTRSGVSIASAGDVIQTVPIKASHFLNSVTARSYQLRVGASGGATLYVNGISTGRKLGGSMISYLSATEIMG